MRKEEDMKIYLSHPYGGSFANRVHAAGIARMYEDIWNKAKIRGMQMINPLKELSGLTEKNTEDQMLGLAVELMRGCDFVLFAPGWKRSRGCRYEHWVARHTGMEIQYLPEELKAVTA